MLKMHIYFFTHNIMKKAFIFSVLMMLVLLASCWVNDSEESASMLSPDTLISGQVEDFTFMSQGFAEYNPSLIWETENTVLFFHQESCGTCKTTEADLIANGVPTDLQVLKIDIDADSSVPLKQKYGVTMKHTFVQVDANGEMIKKWSGSMSGDDIVAQINGSGYAAPASSDLSAISGFDDYVPSLVGKRENTVLFFHQESCGTCKATEENLMEESIPDNVQVLKIDIDSDSATGLKTQYGVTMKHTFVQVDGDGEMIKKWNGSAGIDDILEKIGWEVMMEKDDAMSGKDDAMMEKDIQAQDWKEVMTTELSGTYSNYDASLVGNTDDTVLFFHASWCPSCSAADKGITSGTVPEGLTILKTDYDSSTDLRKKYGVVAQHTFVQIDADGNEIKKWVGWNSVEDIVERVQ